MKSDSVKKAARPCVGGKETIVYNDTIVRRFIAASVVWGLVGLLVGALIALQLAWHPANIHPMLSFGRLRPLHTNAVIFAFVGNMIFAGIYYSTQRLVKARLASDRLSSFHFWGWQTIIVAAAVTLPLGASQAKEYAELEWPIDIAIAVVWVAFAINFFWTLYLRRERQLYVAIWFYIATIVTVAVLHIVNSLAIPVGLLKSYSIFGGAQDALVQWWYGHNAVAFFLTTPVLGIMYYFVPKAADRPVYSYRLSIVHFWALVFVYIWAGPHHLLNTALPEWAQTLGMIFSLMLWAPSWGGMLNGLFTLRGAWDRVRKEPVLKFFAAGLTFYGMATFEGPLLSIRAVSGLAHYTDWIVGHVHSGALGWNGFMAAGMFYWLVPRLYGTKLHNERWAEMHFWVGTIGILLYTVSMWVSGISQGLMWKATDADGSLLYPSFVQTVTAIVPLYWVRLLGGLLYLAGMILMAVNLYRTVRAGRPVTVEAEVPVRMDPHDGRSWKDFIFGQPVVMTAIALVLLVAFGMGGPITSLAYLALFISVALGALLVRILAAPADGSTWHRALEGRAMIFSVLTVLAVLVGGVVQIIPTLLVPPPKPRSGDHVYSPLEIAGRDVYLKEGCYTCHSQMIRPFESEVKRYGEPSTLRDSQFDHPFQWGSKRTGPDLAREGNRNPSAWHYQHFVDPRSVVPGSNMPAYSHLADVRVDFAALPRSLRALRAVGVPFDVKVIQTAPAVASEQANTIAKELASQGISVSPESEMIALIAYLQSLGLNPPEDLIETTAETPVAQR
jgi:cytochrome c oxidase cbb3-type subunit I/II